jgi:uncharacterized SAM-binding protein YcdF (DUF218 family)
LLPASRLIASGGVLRRGDRAVSEMMVDFLGQMGVPAKDGIAEVRSTTTYENLVEVRKIIGANPFILVATACDMRRAMGVARKLQMNPYPSPAGFWASQRYADASALTYLEGFANPSLGRFARLQWACHEYLGYVWYRLLGRI